MKLLFIFAGNQNKIFRDSFDLSYLFSSIIISSKSEDTFHSADLRQKMKSSSDMFIIIVIQLICSNYPKTKISFFLSRFHFFHCTQLFFFSFLTVSSFTQKRNTADIFFENRKIPLSFLFLSRIGH